MPPREEQAKLTRGRGRGSKSARGGGRGGGGRGSKTARGSGRGSKPARGGTVPTHVRPDSRAAAPTAEAAQLALPAAPPSEPAQAPAPSQVVVKKEPRETKEGEMQRMLASLKRNKSASGVQLLQEYEACQGHLAKRAFYYDRFLALPKEVAKVDARKMHGSSKETSENTKDFGWVEAEFIASRKGLQDHKGDPEEAAKLKYWLNLYPSKPHPGRDALPNKEACLYHYKEVSDQITKSATEAMRFTYSGELDSEAWTDTLHAVGALENGSAPKALADRGRPSPAGRQPKPKQAKKEDPEWMVQFKKKALVPLQAARTSAANLFEKVSDAVLQFSLCEDPLIANNDLLILYVAELQKASHLLEKQLEEVKRWLLKKGTSPTEEQATAWTAEFEHRIQDLKRHKEAFDTVTKHKVAELLQALNSS